MRFVLAFLLVAHGVAHLVGFVSSWKLTTLAELSYTTTVFSGRVDFERRPTMRPRSVRASHLERTCVLPGDALIPEPIGALTHAITIRRPAREVWPWRCQS